ncbi:hypothetical protein B0H14DRAFT_2554995 [Mycena olivaceomarginata]|nr:hypothetical protein B0H14DRAFT_2554995 [Mycena olivaceomarginata]
MSALSRQQLLAKKTAEFIRQTFPNHHRQCSRTTQTLKVQILERDSLISLLETQVSALEAEVLELRNSCDQATKFLLRRTETLVEQNRNLSLTNSSLKSLKRKAETALTQELAKRQKRIKKKAQLEDEVLLKKLWKDHVDCGSVKRSCSGSMRARVGTKVLQALSTAKSSRYKVCGKQNTLEHQIWGAKRNKHDHSCHIGIGRCPFPNHRSSAYEDGNCHQSTIRHDVLRHERALHHSCDAGLLGFRLLKRDSRVRSSWTRRSRGLRPGAADSGARHRCNPSTRGVCDPHLGPSCSTGVVEQLYACSGSQGGCGGGPRKLQSHPVTTVDTIIPLFTTLAQLESLDPSDLERLADAGITLPRQPRPSKKAPKKAPTKGPKPDQVKDKEPLLAAHGLHYSQRVTLETTIAASAVKVPGQPVPFVDTESTIFSQRKTNSVTPCASDCVLLSEMAYSLRAWNRLNYATRGVHNHEVYMAQNPGLFPSELELTDEQKHAKLLQEGSTLKENF